MKIYLDFVFLLNFFFDFLLLLGVKIILKERCSYKRILLGSLLGSLSIFFLFFPLNSFLLFLLKIIISIGMILASFGKKNFFNHFIYLYILSIVLGGSLYLLNISFSYKNQGIVFFHNGLSINIWLIIIISPFIIYYYIKENKKMKEVLNNTYKVDIVCNKKVYQFRGMIDTGNTLRDPYKKRGVLLINQKLPISKKRIIYVPFKALNSSGVVKCFIPDKVIIDDKIFNNCLIGIADEKFDFHQMDCILPNQFKEEL